MNHQSCLYEGEVRHHRRTPSKHLFRYDLFLMYVDLEELPDLFRGRWFWSTNRPGFAWFRRNDHFGPPEQALADSVRDLVSDRIGWRPNGPIRLLTHFRYCGYQMNPVSFFYCFDGVSNELVAVVAEVNNTPWNERHCYVLDLRNQADPRQLTTVLKKEFHVSPFFSMDYDYHWQLSTPDDFLSLRIESRDASGTVFDASLSLRKLPITTWNLASVLIRFPLMTLQVFLGIYWQALILWSKGIAYVPHPKTRKPQPETSSVEAEMSSTPDGQLNAPSLRKPSNES